MRGIDAVNTVRPHAVAALAAAHNGAARAGGGQRCDRWSLDADESASALDETARRLRPGPGRGFESPDGARRRGKVDDASRDVEPLSGKGEGRRGRQAVPKLAGAPLIVGAGTGAGTATP
jgi:hypothetical protein